MLTGYHFLAQTTMRTLLNRIYGSLLEAQSKNLIPCF